jgi:hypothetical protein
MKYSNRERLRLNCLWLSLAVGVGFVFLQAPIADAQLPGPRALVLNDLGEYEGIAAQMRLCNWDVATVSTLKLISAGTPGLADYDVVWIPAQSNYPALRRLAETGSPLEGFVRTGGVVVVMGLSPDRLWIDVALGGMDVKPLFPEGAGAVTIAAPDHPMISGTGTGGQPLTNEDLDPGATGGTGNILNPPEGSEVIANNTAGPVVVDYRYRAGHVFVSALQREQDICRANVFLYIQLITR